MSHSTEPHSLTARELAEAYRAMDLNPVEAAEALLGRIAALDGLLNAFCHLDGEATLAEARASADRFAARRPLGPLDGVPVAVKDFFLTKGWPTRKGSRLVDPAQAWDEDAPAIKHLREQGAVLIGKTTTPEFGWKGVTDSPLTGVTRNPWDTRVTPGGSSGGSAAALAAGMAPLALGTDAGGSVRIPGSFTGTVGFKPTFGRIPYAPPSAFGTLGHSGAMARTVDDTRMLFDAIAQHDPRDWTALPTAPIGDLSDVGMRDLRVLFSSTLGYAEVDGEVASRVAEAVTVFEQLGARVEVGHPEVGDVRETWETLWYAGAAALLAGLGDAARADMDPGLVEIAEEGAAMAAVDYLAADQERARVATAYAETLADYDLLVTPSMPIAAFEAGVEVPPGWPHRRWQTWSPFSLPFNLSQQPAISVPCGLTSAGLPVGLQIVAAKHRDDLVVGAARAYEAARGESVGPFERPLETVRTGERP